MFSSSSIGPPDAESANARPRNRRTNAANTSSASSTTSSSSAAACEPADMAAPAKTPSSFMTWGGIATGDGSNGSNRNGAGGGLLYPGSAWVPSWASIQEFATTLLANPADANTTDANRSRGAGGRPQDRKTAARPQPSAWGPAPPGESNGRPRLQDVAAGPVVARDEELRARKMASVLESHPGVNGGLDTRGKFKRRTSDDNLRATATGAGQEAEDCLVYIHHVKPADTYFGIILKYRCREDVFRRANGLWSRDNIQIRRWLALPVDACEIKGRPCDDPSLVSQNVDLLGTSLKSPSAGSRAGLDGSEYFATPSAGSRTPAKSAAGETAEPTWTHVRWVRLESCTDPVEIARVTRSALGFFPPRRKKSIHSTVSTLSTPRQSIDGASDRTAGLDSPNRGSRRQNQSVVGAGAGRGASPMSSSPLLGIDSVSAGASTEDTRPAWMRRPGGVGTMSKSTRAPGPARDYLNKWTTKHLPGLNIETLPSMSVMGSETARFGFRDGEETPALVEGAADEVRDPSLNGRQDLGLDKAAASIETWLRGAFAKGSNTSSAVGSPRSSSLAGRIGRQGEETIGDLIELEDGPGEDFGGPGFVGSRTGMITGATAYRQDSEGSNIRGRSTATSGSRSSLAKGKKAD